MTLAIRTVGAFLPVCSNFYYRLLFFCLRYIAVCRPHQYRAISLTMTNARRLLVHIVIDVIIIIVIIAITIIIAIIDVITIIISFIIIVGLHRPSHCPLVCSQCA